MSTTTVIRVGRSKSGLPTVTETGGGMTSTGHAIIWCGPNGEKLNAIFIPPKVYSNSDAAVFVAKPGMHQVSVVHGRWGERVQVWRLTHIQGDDAHMELVHAWSTADLEPESWPSGFEEAIKAARRKAHAYHARYTAYANPPPPKRLA